MKNRFTSLLILTILFGFAHPLLAEKSDSKPKPRPIPYRGIVGSIDVEKGIFILKNKTNDSIRTFEVTPKTRFEEGKEKKTIRDLKPDMAVRGSCVKTGNREYRARLVRWNPPVSEKDSPKR